VADRLERADATSVAIDALAAITAAEELEVTEAALRWAGTGDADQAVFCSFLDGYRAAGGVIDGLTERDFGKWIAALLGWFSFQGRRVLGDWPTDTPAERKEAAAHVGWTIERLRRSLDSLSRWASWAA